MRHLVGEGKKMSPLFLVEKAVFSNLLLLLKSMNIFSVFSATVDETPPPIEFDVDKAGVAAVVG